MHVHVPVIRVMGKAACNWDLTLNFSNNNYFEQCIMFPPIFVIASQHLRTLQFLKKSPGFNVHTFHAFHAFKDKPIRIGVRAIFCEGGR